MARPTYVPARVDIPWWYGVAAVVVFAIGLARTEYAETFAIGSAVTAVLIALLYGGVVLTARPGGIPEGAHVVRERTVEQVLLWSGTVLLVVSVVLLAQGGTAALWGVSTAGGVVGVWVPGVCFEPWVARLERRTGVRFLYRCDARMLWWPHTIRAPR